MKTPSSIKKSLASLESSIIIWYHPSFLHITNPDEDNDIQVMLASSVFNSKSVQDRIQMVMSTIQTYTPELFDDRLIIIQAYTSDEMEEVLKYVFEQDISDTTNEGDTT